MTSEAVTDRDRATDRDSPSSPWARVLGILVLGSFASATKTARGTRRDARSDEPTEAAA